jgi:hypothetical protein
MSRHIFVRPGRQNDAGKFAEWSATTPENLADPDVLTYPTTFTLCAYDKQGPIVYVPIQQPMFMEALAINSARSDTDVAIALKELTQAVVTQAHIKGSGEIYFLCKSEATSDFAEKQLFEKLPWNLYRVKLADLE